ncbi:MAG: SdrD B-like domain-containing protein, partial [Bacteroidota bacterium]
VTGGTAPYTFLWSNGAMTEDLMNIPAGSYTGTVTDANGCTISATVTVTESSDLNVSADVTSVDCNGDATGAIDLTVTGGTAPYTFLWSNGAMTEDLMNIPAGSYTGTVTDANGCTISATLTVTEPPALGVSADVTNVDCNGDATGAIDLTVTGGTAPYTFLWSNGAMTEDLMNISTGSYTGTVTDANGCTISATVTVTEPPALGVSADVTNVDCNGDATGAIDLTVTGGTAPYTFLWSNGAMTEDLMNIPAGSYTGTVTDANGCMISATVTITEPPALDVSADVTNVDCNGDATGAIDLTVTGGTAPYTFLWSNGAMTEDLMNIPAGSYTGTVTDSNGCTISATVTVTEPPALGVSADVTNVDCNGDATGAIDITVTGGTAPYTFLWSNGAMTEDLMNIPAGSYTGTVTDANGCTISAILTVTEPSDLTCVVEILQEPTDGDNGSVTVIPTGGTPPYSFEWSTGETTQTIDGLAPGTYTATVTDDNGCTTVCSATLDAFAGIGDFVWEDLDLDGLQDPNEPGIEGVTVNLKNENGVVIATTMTDENGFYSFTGLEPGTYSVQFIPPPGFDYTASDIGNDDTIDSDIIMGMMGMTGEYTLGPNEFNMTVDAGLIQPPNGGIFDPCNCLDNATNDLNGQFADTLIIMAYSGLEWTIIDRTNMFLDDPINDPPAVPQLVPLGTVLAEVPMGNGFSQYRLIFRLIDDITYMVSVQAGEFVLDISNTCTYPDIFFDELPPDELCIFDPAFPLDANSTVPGDLTYFIAGQEVDVLDPSTLPEGTYNLEIRLDPLDDEECEAVLILEFDIVDDCPAKVGDFVFLDMDGDGIQDLGDNGIEGVKVTITSQDGSFMDMQFTDENGMYMFMVDPGTYKITFEQPMGLSASPQDQGGNDAVDSDIDPSMLMTDFFTLGPDEVNLTIDAGFRNPCVDNIDDPGTIGFDQEVCGPGNAPNTLVEVTPATGGVGVINYLWMSNTEDPNQNISFWHPIPNSNSPNFTPGPVQVTTFFTRCVRRDDCPYLESNIITVTVNDDAVAEIDGPALGCEGEEITFSSAASGPGADISWSVTGDGNIIGDSDSENLTVVWGSFGLHSVTLTVTENGCTSTSTITISVVNNPMVCGGNLQANGTVNSVPNRDVTVEWMLPDDGYEMSFVVQRSLDGENFEAVGQVTDPAVVLGQVALYEYNEIAPVAGLNYYRVVAYNTLGESMTSNIVQFQLAEDDGQMARIFPNPTVSGIVHIEMTDTDLPAEDMTIEFISATGKSISNQKLQSGADFFDLQIDGKSAGIYFVRITCGDKVETHRVLVNE